MKRLVGGLMAALLLFGAVACSDYNDERGKGDAPVAGRKGDDSPVPCTNMPDGFANVCAKCVYHFAPWAITTTTDRIAIMFQAPDQCGGKVVAGRVTEGNG
jgi:hypothetical protein